MGLVDRMGLQELLDMHSSEYDEEHAQWVRIGHEIGAECLGVVLRELGGLRPSVPTQQGFRDVLRRNVRDELVRQSLRGDNYAEVADDFDLSVRMVRYIEQK